MNNILKYKDYRAVINYSAEDNVLYGKIEGINALVTFEAETVSELQPAFEEAVNDYLVFCEEHGLKPEKEYKGSFNVRISPDLHKLISAEAESEHISLNKYIENALRNSLKVS